MDKTSRAISKRMATQRARVRLRKREESIPSGARAELLAALEAQAFKWIARGREANLELGRIFLQIKAIVGHGRWQRYYRERFCQCGVPLRTGEEYMKAAREADADLKTAESAVFPVARDAGAQKMRATTKKAEAEVGGAVRHKLKKEDVRLEGPALYQLPLHLTGDERDATDALQKLAEWPRAEQKIIDLLRQLHLEFDIANSRPAQRSGE